MSRRGRPPLDFSTRRYILRLARYLSIRATAREARVGRNTARKYIRAGEKDF